MQDNQLTPTNNEPPQTKPTRLKPKQKRTIEYYFNPESETFSNLYKSAVKAGFRPSYALNIASNKPLWLSETVESTLKLESQHIINGVQSIATNPNVNSRSPADTNLKAYEMLGKWAGLDGNSNTTTVIVQPILGGVTKPKKIDNERV